MSAARGTSFTGGGGLVGRRLDDAGTTTPSVTITIFIAASTDMSSSMTSSSGTITMSPEVGFGVVGTYTHTCFLPVFSSDLWRMPDAVTKPKLHISLRGYSIMTTLRNDAPVPDTSVSVRPFTPE